MKKYLSLIISAILFTTGSISLQAQSSSSKVNAAIAVFPYQQRAAADAALVAMDSWGKSEWKSFMKLLNDDSLKVKASYALNAYVNAASLDANKKVKATTLLKQYLSSAKNEYAKILLQSQLNLLADKSVIDQANRSLPGLPEPATYIDLNYSNEQKLLLLEDQMDAAKNPVEKRNILSKIAHIPGFSSFMLVSKSLSDADIAGDAAIVLAQLALSDNKIKGAAVRNVLEKALPLIKGEDSAVLVSKLQPVLKKMPYDYGFVSLFNGEDLTGWKALVGNPVTRAKMSAADLAKAQTEANEKTKGDWVVKDGLLVFTGHGDNLVTDKKYADFEMYVDWKITAQGDAGIYLRGTPQVQIWDTSRRDVGAEVGSGGLYNNQKNASKPLVLADNKIGEWNRFHIIMKGEKVTVYLNGVLVTDNVVLENFWDRNQPIFPKEQIELQAHGTYVAYRNIYLREISTNEPYGLTAEEKKQGFISLFDGSNLDQWTGNKEGYKIDNGSVMVDPDAAGGNLYTNEEFADFIYRFEFQLTPGANNGIGIRAPLEGDAAYQGMEIQVLDSESPKYKDLKPYQYHGSVYGVIAAKRGFLLPTGEWNKEEIWIKGSKIKVTLNGTVILDGDIKTASKNFTETVDHQKHPGLSNKKGHIGFLGHGDVLRFRNMRVKKL
jgi:hypothetical protein